MSLKTSFFIVGGGPSLNGFDFLLLNGLETIGCNKVAWVVNTKYIHSLDRFFISQERGNIAKLGERAHIACDEKYYIPGCTHYKRDHNSIFSKKPEYIAGKNTGHGAVNLAAHMGAEVVHLLGIDMNANGHWHDGYPWGFQKHQQMRAWAKFFDDISPKLSSRGIRVINWSKDSGVSAYEKRDIAELPEYLHSQDWWRVHREACGLAVKANSES